MYNRYYNILDQEIHKQLYERVFNGKWNLTNVSDPRLDKTNFWYQDLNDDKLITVNLFNLLKQKINDNNDSFKLLRVYANGQTHGQCGSWHTDQDDSGHYTLLYYLNLEWDMSGAALQSLKMNSRVHTITHFSYQIQQYYSIRLLSMSV